VIVAVTDCLPAFPIACQCHDSSASNVLAKHDLNPRNSIRVQSFANLRRTSQCEAAAYLELVQANTLCLG